MDGMWISRDDLTCGSSDCDKEHSQACSDLHVAHVVVRLVTVVIVHIGLEGVVVIHFCVAILFVVSGDVLPEWLVGHGGPLPGIVLFVGSCCHCKKQYEWNANLDLIGSWIEAQVDLLHPVQIWCWWKVGGVVVVGGGGRREEGRREEGVGGGREEYDYQIDAQTGWRPYPSKSRGNLSRNPTHSSSSTQWE